MGQYDEKSIELFQQMQQEGLMIPDTLNFIWVLNALASLEALEEGRHVHMQIMQFGCQLDAYVGSSLTEFVATFVYLLSACIADLSPFWGNDLQGGKDCEFRTGEFDRSPG